MSHRLERVKWNPWLGQRPHNPFIPHALNLSTAISAFSNAPVGSDRLQIELEATPAPQLSVC
jgi:hypothetical protein